MASRSNQAVDFGGSALSDPGLGHSRMGGHYDPLEDQPPSGVGGWDHPLEPMRLDGDFYADQDDVKRGMTVCHADFDFNPCKGLSLGGDHEDAWSSKFMEDEAPAFQSLDWGSKQATPEPQFSDSYTPQEAPKLGLACTHVTLNETSAAEVSRTVYDFMKKQAGVSFQKVSPEKFTMKADVIQDDGGYPLDCTLKVRVLRRAAQVGNGDHLLVEFSRRKGDSIAFCRFFEKVADHLNQSKLRVVPPTNAKGMPIKPLKMFVPPPPPMFNEDLGIDRLCLPADGVMV